MIARFPARRLSQRRSAPKLRRRGVVLVESSLIYSVTLLLLLGVIVVGLGVFQYQQLAALTREGARWASVHGPKYSSEQTQPAISSSDIMNNAVLARALVLDPSALTCSLDSSAWNNGMVSFTLNYTWTPSAFTVYLPPVSMNSTAVTPILY